MNGKKIISMLLAVVMVLQMIPGLTLPVSAVDGVTCTLTGEVLTISGSGTIESSDIPNPRYFTKVIIEEGVTSIGNTAFRGCSSLESVVIPSSVTEIGNYAFQGCSSLETVEYWGIKEPSIGNNAFSDPEYLDFYVPEGYEGNTFYGEEVSKTLSPAVKYSIIIGSVENGTITANKEEAAEGEIVTLTATPAMGYELESWSVTYGESGKVDVSDENTFIMPKGDVTVTAVFKEASAPATYQVTVSGDIKHGTVTADPTTAEAGATVTLTATPETGYVLDGWSVTYADNQSVTVTDNKFTMPDGNVTVTASFKLQAEYPVWVQGVRITSANMNDVLEDGKVSYDPATYTLTLKNASISSTAAGQAAIRSLYPEYTLKIVGEGANTITANGGSGIYSNNQNISISGGTFNIKGSNFGISAENGKVEIKDATVTATGGTYSAVYAKDGITIQNGTLKLPKNSVKNNISGGTLYIGTKGFQWDTTDNKYYCINHDWSYTANGATLTAQCSESDRTETLVISASNSTYDGTEKKATLSASSIGDITALPAIQYQKQTGENTWGEATAIAPTEAGTYKASLTVTDKIISVEYKVSEKPITSVNIDVTTPVGGAAPDTDAGTGEGYSASEVTWSPSVSDKFAYNTIYTASVTLTVNDNHQFASELSVEGWNKTVNADGTVTLTKEFTTASAKITSVTSPSDVTLTEHKVDADAVIAGLPTNVAIAAEDGTRSLPISWVLKANTTYNPAPNAVNEFTWTAEAGELDANSQTLTGTIKVTNPAPTAVSITAKENPKTVVYDGSAIDLSTLFDFDETVGLATYTVTPINESAGSLNGSVLTITKAGKFTITVNTAANGIYGAGVATMTLDVNKANGSATITMENWTAGEATKAPVVTSETNDVSAVTYLYESTDGKGYSNAAVPTAVGKYKVTAVLPSNDLYNEVAVSVDFEIKARTIIDSIFDWFDREDEEDDRVSITIAGDEKSIKAKATVSGKTATVLAPSAAQLNKIIAKTVETGTVEIDLSSLDKDISKVNLPIKTLKAIVKAAEELGNDTEAMKVLLPNGLAAEFDDKALRAIIDQVKCDQVSLVVEKTGTKRLNSKQKAALSELDVYGGYEAYLYCPKANKRISDFKGGIATLSVPFTVPTGKSAENFSVWYVSDSGKLEQLSTWYSGKKVNWDVSHFSDFIIAYNTNTVVKENPNTGAF